MSEQIQDLLKVQLSKYLQSRVFQESLTNGINDAVEAATKPLQEKISALESQLTQIKEKYDANKQYSKRCNIQITGIEESDREDCYIKVIDFCNKELCVKIDPKEIDGAHRFGRPENGRHRSMIVKPYIHSRWRHIFQATSLWSHSQDPSPRRPRASSLNADSPTWLPTQTSSTNTRHNFRPQVTTSLQHEPKVRFDVGWPKASAVH